MAGTPELGAKIKEARREKGWKQKHLAAEVSVEPITVSRWERGATTPDLDVLTAVAEATGKPVTYFVDNGTTRAQAAATPDAVERLESAADRIAEASERIAAVAAELAEALRASRARA
jgi:transcriptional regulator with XRE-family HTH domain